MFGRSASSMVISLLAFLRILPHGRSKVLDTFCLIIWILLTLGLILVYTYFDHRKDFFSFEKSIPGVFNFLSTLVIPPAQIVLTIPALAYLCQKNPDIVQDRKLPHPRKLLLFIGVLVMYFVYSVIPIYTDFQHFGIMEGIGKFYYCVWAMVSVLSCFVIGTSLEKFCTELNNVDKNSTSRIEELAQKLSHLKIGLSPMLFMICSIKSILLITAALWIIDQGPSPPVLISTSVLAMTMLDLAYVILVIDDTLAVYKSLTFKLRPLLHKAVKEERENILYLIMEIKDEGPFTALGFFNVERSTLTSLLSTILTYLIVLVQFQPQD